MSAPQSTSDFARLAGLLGRPPVILQVVPALVTGGVERGTVDVAAAVAAAGGTAVVASSGGPMVAELERAGARHVTLPLASKNPLRMWRNVGRLADLIRSCGADVVHARSRAPAWSAWAAAGRAGVPFVTTVHSPYGSGGGWIRPFKERYNSVMAKGERVIVISAFVAAEVQRRFGVPAARIRVIHRGIDFARFDPDAVTCARIHALLKAWAVPLDVPVIVLPGRLTRWKGQAVLIEALARMARRDAYAVLVGSDQGRAAYSRELGDLAARLGVAERIRMPGEVADVPAALALADVAVSASIEPEAFGRVMAEALAMGRPLVAAAHGAALEVVRDGETGWLVPPGDAPALARALDEALALDEAARGALARRAVADVRARFSLRQMTDATLAVYAELLHAAG